MTESSPGERRVLVIDDDHDCADTVAMVLERLGAEVRVAYSGLAGVSLFPSFKPELVLLDIGMPGMDGYATIAALRAAQSDRPVKIVALTGWGRSEDRMRTLAAGFDQHLVKPSGLDDLRALLESLDG